jgi:hypothetical protein
MTNLWVTPAELPVSYQDSIYAEDACQVASNLLWTMSGRKYHGTTTVTERYFTAIDAFRYQGSSAKQFFPHMIGGSVFNLPAEDWNDSAYQSDGSSSLSRIRLRGKPVQEVHLVRSGYDGSIIPADAYYLAEHSTLIANKGTPWTPGNLEITYTFGQQPPTAGRHAARVFAIELIKAWEGDDCALPDRVTSVSRQGVSYTILDNQDFLENFRTGIYVIDLFLKTANPAKALAPTKVFSPDIPRARRAAPKKPLVLSVNSSIDVELKKSNDFTGSLTITCAGAYAAFANYNTSDWELELTANSWAGSNTINYPSAAASFRVQSGVTYIDLSFNYKSTYAALGHTDPGTWILYAKDLDTNATTELLEANLQIVKVSSTDIDKTGLRDSNFAIIKVKEGETFSKTLRWRRDGELVNLTNFTAAMQVRSSLSDTNAALSLVSVAGSSVNVSSATVASNVATVTTATAHGLIAGNVVVINNFTTGAGEVQYLVKSAPTANTFTIDYVASNGSVSIGAGSTAIKFANIVLGGTAGTVVINLSDEITAALTAGTYIYDLELTSSTGSKTRLIEGTFIVDAEVTTI